MGNYSGFGIYSGSGSGAGGGGIYGGSGALPSDIVVTTDAYTIQFDGQGGLATDKPSIYIDARNYDIIFEKYLEGVLQRRGTLYGGAFIQDQTWTLPNATGTIALTSDIPTISGTTNTIPIFTGATAIGDSEITWDGESFYVNLTSGFFRFDDGSTYIQIFPNVATIRTNDSYLILEGNKGAQLTDGSGTATWEAGALTLLESVGGGLLEIRSSSGDIEFTESGGGLQKISFAGGVGAYTYTLPSATGTLALDVVGGYLPLSGGTMTGATIIEDDTYIEFGTANATWQFKKNSATGYLEITNTDEGFVTTLFDQEALWSAKLYVEERIVFTDGGYAGGVIKGSILPPTSTNNNYQLPEASGTIALTSDIKNPSLRNVTATDTFATANETINCTANTFTVNLPTAVGIQGTTYTLVNSGTGTITLDPNGTETINGNTTIDLVQYVSRTVQSDGTNWIII